MDRRSAGTAGRDGIRLDVSRCSHCGPSFGPRVFAFHDRDEIGPRMLTRLAKVTGLPWPLPGSAVQTT